MPTGHAIAMGLRAAYLAMHRQTDARMARFGVTADQFVILAVLAERDGITQQELVRRAFSDPNTIRAMLVLLERAGLVARAPHPTDGRARSVSLTPSGRRVYQTLWAESDALRKRMLELFAPSEARGLVELLDRLARGLDERGERPRRARASRARAEP
jgi:DNA-binding MarR family transcriptional regulator